MSGTTAAKPARIEENIETPTEQQTESTQEATVTLAQNGLSLKEAQQNLTKYFQAVTDGKHEKAAKLMKDTINGLDTDDLAYVFAKALERGMQINSCRENSGNMWRVADKTPLKDNIQAHADYIKPRCNS